MDTHIILIFHEKFFYCEKANSATNRNVWQRYKFFEKLRLRTEWLSFDLLLIEVFAYLTNAQIHALDNNLERFSKVYSIKTNKK